LVYFFFVVYKHLAPNGALNFAALSAPQGGTVRRMNDFDNRF